MADKVPQNYDQWRKSLKDSTFGLALDHLVPQDQSAAFADYKANIGKGEDPMAATSDAVNGFVTIGLTNGMTAPHLQPKAAATIKKVADDAAKAKADKAAKDAAAKSGTTPPTTATGSASATGSAADVRSQTGQNSTAGALTQGPFSAQTSQNSLFGSSGLDLTTPIPGTLPETGSTGEQLTGRGSFSGDITPAAGTYTPEVTQTADQWLNGLYKMDPKELAALQVKLYGAGWYDPSAVPNAGVIPYGRVDAETIKAYESVMQEAARYNAAGKHTTIQAALSQGAPRVPGAGTPNPAGTQSFINPTDLKATLQSSAQNLLGQDASIAQAQGFASYYQALEKASYVSSGAAASSAQGGGEGTYTAAPSAQAAADAYLKQNDPNGVQAYGMASRAAEFQQLLGSATGR